jgi:Domain of unknown function (DUF4381)
MKPPAPDLSGLHDFVSPVPPSWMPQTIGWYVLFAVLAALGLFLVARATRHWWKNRYRREAIREIQSAPLAELSEILKRTALITWPRSRVASLTGKSWLDFLADSSGLREFESAPGDRIEIAAISKPSSNTHDEQRLRELASDWVKKHHV